MKLIKGIALVSAAGLLAACGSDDDGESAPVVNAPPTYSFTSKLDETKSSVSYSGQATRQLLIADLKKLIETADLYNVTQDAAGKAEVIERLNSIYAIGTKDVQGKVNLIDENVFNGAVEATPVSISVADILQLGVDVAGDLDDYADLSGDKNLQGKLAGCDNNMTNDTFIGWEIAAGDLVECGQKLADGEEAVLNEQDKAHTLIQLWFEAIGDLATDENAETTFVSSSGLDYQQLIQKFLLGAVTYSQAAEDYMKATKGLLKQNSEADGAGKSYTSLEHQWDEGFGYFGAQRDYNLRTDAEVKAAEEFDTDENGLIDLYSEYSFGHSINAVKRDSGNNITAVDFSKNAMDAFLNGRQLIQDNFGTDPVQGEGYHKYLVQYAETALNNWENAIAATVIHYINDYTADINSLSSAEEDASFADIAKHWSEMKGFALSLQFSPVAQISVEDLTTVHTLMGEAPVTTAGEAADAYLADLAEARDILQAAYGFSTTNVANW